MLQGDTLGFALVAFNTTVIALSAMVCICAYMIKTKSHKKPVIA